MTEKTARATEKAVQRCIDASCGATYGLRERVYVCSRCGGTLEIESHPRALREATGDPASLRQRWAARAASHDPIDQSGVWRYRDLLPFEDPIPFVTLFEGNTPLYHGPRSANYCGLDDLRLKHQGCNPTGSFKDTGMSAAITQAVVLGAKTAVCASTGNTSAIWPHTRAAPVCKLLFCCHADKFPQENWHSRLITAHWFAKSMETSTTACA